MKNKNLLFKFGLVAFAISSFGLSFTSATSFKLQIEKMNALQDVISKSIVPIHFADNGNDFGGFMYFSNSNIKQKDNCIAEGGDKSGDRYDGECGGTHEPVFDEYCPFGDRSGNQNDGKCDWEGEGEPEQVYYPSDDQINEFYEILDKDGNVVKECQTHIKGFYYNAERGERLWPLDEETWSKMQGMENLETKGGIYTACRNPGYAKKACEECEGGVWENGMCGCEDERKDAQGYCMTEEQTCEGEECPEVVDSAVCAADLSKQYEAELNFYGQVKHRYPYQAHSAQPDNSQTFGFVIGTTYNFPNTSDWISIESINGKAGLGPTFVMFEKMVPMGLVYDYNGGIGFAGCEITKKTNSKGILRHVYDKLMKGDSEEDGLQSAFSYSVTEGLRPNEEDTILDGSVECKNIGVSANSLIKVIIEGLVGMNRESDFSSVGNQLDQKMQYFSSSDINNATILNYAKKKSEELCRGKWKQINAGSLEGDVVCLDLNGATFSVGPEFKGRTLIARNGSIAVSPEDKVHDESGNDKYYDIFISDGNLLINESSSTRKFAFNTQGFVDESHTSSNDDVITYYKNELKNIDDPYNHQSYYGELSGVGSLIRGNFIVDGKIKGASQEADGKLYNKYFIHGKFTTRDSFKDLENTFLWRCNDGYVVDKDGNILEDQGRYCPPSLIGDSGQFIWMNPYEGAALVVIDQNYDSPLYW